MTVGECWDPVSFLAAGDGIRIDIGTKTEILTMIRDLAHEGKAVIVISSEYAELLAVSDRVLILRDGTVQQELARKDITDEESLQHAVQGV